MNKALIDESWNDYLQTPTTPTSPVKIDAILEERLKAFLQARLRQLQGSDSQ